MTSSESIIEARLVQPPPLGILKRAQNSRIAILAVLFLMTGFLGIPLLWLNPNFSRLERWIWAIVVTVYTFVLIAITCGVVYWSLNSIRSNL